MHERKFDPSKKAMLNQQERLKMLPPEKIWQFIDYPEPSLIVDVGAGTGFITNALAAQKPNARVMALDIEPQMIEEMHVQFRDTKAICPVLMQPNTIPLPDNQVDVLWMVNLFHELDHPGKMLNEVHRALKPGGRMLIIDWDRAAASLEAGPPKNHRYALEDIERIVNNSPLKVTNTRSFEKHTGLVATPPR